VVAAGFPSLKIFGEITVMKPVDQHFDSFLYRVLQCIFPKVFQVGYDAASITDDAITDGGENLFIGIINQMKQSFYFLRFLHGLDVFSSGGIQPGLTRMNIAEVKKNAMTILSTNPFRMFISGTNSGVLNG
jgi:hypothetical protein